MTISNFGGRHLEPPSPRDDIATCTQRTLCGDCGIAIEQGDPMRIRWFGFTHLFCMTEVAE